MRYVLQSVTNDKKFFTAENWPSIGENSFRNRNVQNALTVWLTERIGSLRKTPKVNQLNVIRYLGKISRMTKTPLSKFLQSRIYSHKHWYFSIIKFFLTEKETRFFEMLKEIIFLALLQSYPGLLHKLTEGRNLQLGHTPERFFLKMVLQQKK